MRSKKFGFLRMFVSGLLAVTAFPSTYSAASRPRSDGAPLYLAQRGDAKVYILGACGGSTAGWLTGQAQRSLAESSDFWRELPIADISKASIEYGDRLGALDNGNLFDLLDANETQRILNASYQFDVTRERLAPMKIWYAARILTFASYAQAGRSVGQAQDPELVLTQLAKKQHKRLHAETSDWDAFVDFFDKMPVSVQKQYLSYSLDDIERPPEGALAGDAACGRGDPSYFEDAATAFSQKYPELYDYLNGERDAEWARKIKRFLSDGGRHFVVVGINHTVGPRSIQNELEMLGIAVRRM